MTEKAQCPLCGKMLAQKLLSVNASRDVAGSSDVDCRMCSQCTITWEAALEIKDLPDRKRADLASWVAEQAVQDQKPPTICSSNYAEGSDTSNDYRVNQILETLVPRSISEVLDRILENLGARTGEPGERCGVDNYDIYLCCAIAPWQMDFYLRALQEHGWLRQIADGWSTMMITPSGWIRIGELQSAGARTDQVFVAMSFKPALEAAWRKGLSTGIAAAGYRPLRVDKKEHNEKICDRIMTEIQRSAFLVADVTRHRQGVYFEAGYAMSLGIPVIWTCQKREMNRAHFDTRQYNHIRWETPEELAKALEYRIRRTIGEPPDK